jgi:CheY-like chemotaxis protein
MSILRDYLPLTFTDSWGLLNAYCQPDLVFLDFHLPDCEGDVILTKLKEHERTKYTPIYILSADARNEQIQRLKKLGAVDYLVKPFDIERLLEIIESHEPLIVTEK